MNVEPAKRRGFSGQRRRKTRVIRRRRCERIPLPLLVGRDDTIIQNPADGDSITGMDSDQFTALVDRCYADWREIVPSRAEEVTAAPVDIRSMGRQG